jgi:hypothetical protein
LSAVLLFFSAPLTNHNLMLNGIGDEGAKALAAVLPRCVQMQNGMRPAPSDKKPTPLFRISVGVYLVSAPLTDLDISRNEIGVEGAKAIAAVLPQVR